MYSADDDDMIAEGLDAQDTCDLTPEELEDSQIRYDDYQASYGNY